jgi:hypothetical protein
VHLPVELRTVIKHAYNPDHHLVIEYIIGKT